MRKLSKEKRNELVELYISGIKTKELASRFNVSLSTIRSVLHRNSIPLRLSKEENTIIKNPDERRKARLAYLKRWRENNIEKLVSYRLKRSEGGKYKTPFRLKRYGIDFEQYKEILISQNLECPICGKILDFSNRYPDVEHCHQTGKVRGIVHNKCNRLLGCAEDNIETLQRAINYLRNSYEIKI